MSIFRPNPSVVVRALQNAIAQHDATTNGVCAVLWQGPKESARAFSKRVATARERLPDARLLVVVCAPGAASKSPGVIPVELPPAMLPFFANAARYRVCYGGRGAGRSWTFARVLLVLSMARRNLILCAREFQNSIDDSIHRLLCDQIAVLGLGAYFEIQNTTIRGRNGSEFIFSGIRNNATKIKSLEGVNICFVEEAEKITARSWEILIPTIRSAGSEIWAAFNPDLTDDPTYERFVISPPDNAIILRTTHADNPWFPAPLRAEMEYLKRVDPDAHAHVWLGECRTHSDAQVFKGKYAIESFEPSSNWDGPYLGADWGFAQDPTTCVKAWIFERTLFVEHEAYAVGCDIDRTPQLFDTIPGARQGTMRADSARPETISFMQRFGYGNMIAVEKWSGSVEDGIQHLRSYEKIIVHPRCTHTAEEMRLYSFRVDRLSGDVMPDPLDRHNHCIDALRYALQPMIRRGGPDALLEYYRQTSKPTAGALANRPNVVIRDLTGFGHER